MTKQFKLVTNAQESKIFKSNSEILIRERKFSSSVRGIRVIEVLPRKLVNVDK